MGLSSSPLHFLQFVSFTGEMLFPHPVADNPSQGGLPVSREKAHRETGATVNIRDFDQGAKNQRLHDSK
jgi:hypothetical protein